MDLSFATIGFICAAVVVAVAVVMLATLATFLMRMRTTRPARPVRVAREEVPPDTLAAMMPAIEAFAARGFVHGRWHRIPHSTVGVEGSEWLCTLTRADSTTKASVLSRPEPTSRVPFSLSLDDVTRDGRRIGTLNFQLVTAERDIKTEELVDAQATSLDALLAFHAQRVASQHGATIVDEQDLGQTLTEAFDAAIAHGTFVPAGHATFRFSAWAATVLAARVLVRKFQMQLSGKAAAWARYWHIAPSAQDDAAMYRQVLSIRQVRDTGWQRKAIWLTVSLIAFAASMVLLFGFDARLLLMMVAVLFVHELGHLAAMHAFGYRDLRMLFIPFMGAAAVGVAPRTTLDQEAIVYLAGPLPGLALGWWLLANPMGVAVLDDLPPDGMLFAALLVVINALNLVPVMPLDGGQIVNRVVFNRHPRWQAGFFGLCVVGLLAGGLMLSEPIVLAFAVFLSIGLRFHWQAGTALSRLRALGPVEARPEQPEPEHASDARVERVFDIMSSLPIGGAAFASKRACADYLLRNEYPFDAGIGARAVWGVAYFSVSCFAAWACYDAYIHLF